MSVRDLKLSTPTETAAVVVTYSPDLQTLGVLLEALQWNGVRSFIVHLHN